MRIGYIHFYLLFILVFTGCNSDVFIEERNILRASLTEYEFPDTGDTLKLFFNQQNWGIKNVSFTTSEGTIYQGHIMQDGVTRYPSIMSMSGLGEIWEDKTFNGFKLIRDHYDALTIIMNPNYSHHSCELQITLVKDFQILDLSFTQIPSRGYLIDRIEWDPTITKSKQYNTSNWDERFIRKIYIPMNMYEGDNIVTRPELMQILKIDSLEFPIPDPYPEGRSLIFSGDAITIYPHIDLYKLDMSSLVEDGTREHHNYYISYSADFYIYIRHKSDDSIVKCFQGHFANDSPYIQ